MSFSSVGRLPSHEFLKELASHPFHNKMSALANLLGFFRVLKGNALRKDLEAVMCERVCRQDSWLTPLSMLIWLYALHAHTDLWACVYMLFFCGGASTHASHFHPLGEEALPPRFHKKAYFLTWVVAAPPPKSVFYDKNLTDTVGSLWHLWSRSWI